MCLSEDLKKLRKEKGFTQEYIAKKLYVSIQTINKWENGKCLPDVINLVNIAKFYKVSLDELLRNEISGLIEEDKKDTSLIFSNLIYLFKKLNFLKLS
ncbi:helix-turn-helix domain-containing protein [Staphylococcus shinii]|uniref:helix-turn-helix domain-containing protein n=2 Tax=Staphylococcus shinii TaxID=2912228 RepID=UPI003F83B0A7